MNPQLDFANLVRQLLPTHKRQPVRLALLRAFTAPLAACFASFVRWRQRVRVELQMNSQTGVLEGFLRAKYDDPRIRVETFADRGLAVGLPSEGTENAVHAGRGDSPQECAAKACVPLPGELREAFGDADFVVRVPSGHDAAVRERLRIDTDRYKQVTVTCKIIEK